uniref:Uncharacterized protein n=1 Tax=Arundo donax TaxID=35708 RepID=A0A0A8ZCS7_ARUDO
MIMMPPWESTEATKPFQRVAILDSCFCCCCVLTKNSIHIFDENHASAAITAFTFFLLFR